MSITGYDFANIRCRKSHLTLVARFVLLSPWNLRKDPITRSWVIIGDEWPKAPPPPQVCPFCGPAGDSVKIVATLPGLNGNPWSARSVVHPQALYHIEGEAGRRGEGLYDRMMAVGAHEVLVENPSHDGHMWNVIGCGGRAGFAAGRVAHSGSEEG